MSLETLAARPFHLGVGSLATGLAVSNGAPAIALGAAAAVLAVLLLARTPVVATLSASLLLTGAAIGDARLAALDAPADRVRDGPVRELRAHLVTGPRVSPFGSSADVEVAGGRLSGARLLLRVPRWTRLPADTAIGSQLLLTGRLRPLAEQGPSSTDRFDFTAHLRRRGVAGELLLDRARLAGRRGGVAGALDRMRERAEDAVAAGLPAREAALARGMVLGQDEAIDESTRQDWRDSGLAHLLAVSGQNVMLLVALALPLLALARLGPSARGGALLILVALYVPLAGAGPSLQRAGIMGAAGIAAMMLSRPASRWYALLLAATVTLALSPRAAGDPGWQLSFVAVGGILLVGRPLAATLARGGFELFRDPDGPLTRALVRGMADGIAITAAATLATAPLVAHHFGTVPVAGLLANLVALPAVAPAMWLGMTKGALGLVGGAVPLADEVARLLGPPARLPLAYLEHVAERCADLPGGRLELPLRSPASVCAAYVLLGVTFGTATALRRRARPAGIQRFPERAAAWRRAPRRLRVVVAAVVVGVLGLATTGGLGAPSPPGELTVRFLDVGQGDATLVQHPDGTAVLFDGGPPEGGVTRLLRRAGVRRLAVVVATHASRDHHGGLVDVLARYPVGLLLDGGDGSSDPGFQAVLDEAARRGIRRVPATAPLTLRAGGLLIEILSPPPRPPGPAPEDPNPRAVVAVVSAGAFDVLLSADAESETLVPLDLPDVEAMKVPHHGSADPGLPSALERLRPQVAAIEVGPNTYGHPTPSTLAALERAEVTTYRTDRDGTVTLTVERGRMQVHTEH
ncbi:MAG TPA: ComEC/Rec2 family competence protein [Thermoleophilaceae bacterium]|nr:ComEC/Rec2 family competence protein [Thermoleophilaceae bacterium]